MTDSNVQLVTKNEPSGEQVNTGVALVKFSSTEDADRATKEQHLAIHGCPVEVREFDEIIGTFFRVAWV